MAKNYNAIWSFDFGGPFKTYGYRPKQVLMVWGEEGSRDFAVVFRAWSSGSEDPYSWAALQAGYHVAMAFLKSSSGNDLDEKVEDGAYFLEKREILRAAGVK